MVIDGGWERDWNRGRGFMDFTVHGPRKETLKLWIDHDRSTRRVWEVLKNDS